MSKFNLTDPLFWPGWDKIFHFLGTYGTPEIFRLGLHDLRISKLVLFFQFCIYFNNKLFSYNMKLFLSWQIITFYRKPFLLKGNSFLSHRKAGCLISISPEIKDFLGTWFPGSLGKPRPVWECSSLHMCS